MRKFYFLAFLFLSIQLSFGQTKPDHRRHIVFDITGSMIGRGVDMRGIPNKDIWEMTVTLLEKQLNSFSSGEEISLYLFGSEVNKKGNFIIDNSGETVAKIISIVEEVKSKNLFETCTCTFFALNAVFDSYVENSINTTYLFTDGNHTSGCDPNCSEISAEEVTTKFDNITKKQDSEFLYIYKLKPQINVPETLKDHDKVIIVEDALNELKVIITPVNSTIMLNKDILVSNQTFSFTGTGVREFLEHDSLNIHLSNFELKNESSINQSAQFEPRILILDNNIHEIELQTLNNLGLFDNGIYKGEVLYLFDNNSTIKQINADGTNINIEIVPGKTKVIFNNTTPTVTIKFIDKN